MTGQRLTVLAVVVLGCAAISMAAKGTFTPNAHKLDGQVKLAPEFTHQETMLTITGTLTGLDKSDALVVMSTTAMVEVDCTNRGGHTAKGQRASDQLNLLGVQRILAGEMKHGEAFVSMKTAPVLPGTPELNGCPNDHWRVTVTAVEFISATVEVFQDEILVFREMFSL